MNVKFNDVLYVYEKEIVKNTKNKRKLFLFEKNKMQYINEIVSELSNDIYTPNDYNIFIIYEPKLRVIMSQNIKDKIVNHYLARYILLPKLSKCLDIRNIATRENMGTDYGIKLLKKYYEMNKKYEKFYILKTDIRKYFYNIDHEVLKCMLKDKLDKSEYNIICKIIDSTNSEYINKKIDIIKNHCIDTNEIPYYYQGKGLSLGAMTNQFLSIFYLSEIDHYIIYDLKIKHYIRYMDDLILIYPDKKYLEQCLIKIEQKIKNVCKLNLNMRKTKIICSNNYLNFLGYRFMVYKNKTIIKPKKNINYIATKKIKTKIRLYEQNRNNLASLFSSYQNYYNSFKYTKTQKIKYNINNILDIYKN